MNQPQQSIIEKILKLNKSKEAKLGNLVFCIEQKENLIRKSWLDLEKYAYLPLEY